MLERCLECSTPVPEGHQYCIRCQDDDGETAQLKITLPELQPVA